MCSIFSLFVTALYLTILLNVSLSSANVITSVFAYIDAALGALYNNANSPKESPGWYTLRCLTS